MSLEFTEEGKTTKSQGDDRLSQKEWHVELDGIVNYRIRWSTEKKKKCNEKGRN
jgi:hypothetical protein